MFPLLCVNPWYEMFMHEMMIGMYRLWCRFVFFFFKKKKYIEPGPYTTYGLRTEHTPKNQNLELDSNWQVVQMVIDLS
jgi:hypothetical protein